MADGTITLKTEVDTRGVSAGLGKIKSAAGKVGKAFAAAGAAGVSAFAAIGKAAISSYADYEQFVGGVETLFKESSDIVLKYAQDAYKAAGLSANEYMETVTSFSASLLQSLGGDTAKAAEYGNQAVIDMSDNANKMGTDISRIQDAYQGFAKQNFTMLDNLKLGYGGTKTEMERLLADAEKIKAANGEMADYSIDSFADIVEAIHVVQENMGITGTTAEEAATTIQGSLNMVKSSWKNLLTGLADDTQDFDKLLDNLVDSTKTLGANLMPRIRKVVNSIPKMIQKLMPEVTKYAAQLLPDVLNAAIEGAKGLSSLTSGLLKTLPGVIASMAPQIAQAGTQIAESLVDGISAGISAISPALGDAVSGVLNSALNAVETILPIISGHIDGILAALGTFTAGFGAFKVFQTAIQAVDKLKTAFALLNATILANPIGLIVGAIGAATAGFAIFYTKYQDAIKSTDEYKRSLAGIESQIKDNTKAVDALRDKQYETLSSYDSEAKTIQRYKDELDTLVDANGRVAESDQIRANFLIGELNNALGTEISMTDGVISKYQELQSEIDNLILKKKAVALLEANEEVYNDAVEQRTAAFETYNTAQGQVLETKKQIADTQKELNDLEMLMSTGDATAEQIASWSELQGKLNDLKIDLNEYETTAKDAYSAVGEYSAIIADQTALDAAIQSGNMDEITKAYDNMRKHALLSNATVEGDTAATLENLKNDVIGKLGATAGAWDEYKDNSTAAAKEAAQTAESELKAAVDAYQAAGGDISALAPYFGLAGISLSHALGEGISEGAGEVTAAAESGVEAAGEGAKATAQAKGAEAGSAFNEGFAENADSGAAAEAAAEGAKSAGESAKSTAQAKGQETGTEFDSAEATGMQSGSGQVSAAASDVISAAASTAGSTAESEGQSIGANLAAGIASGISSNSGSISEAATSAIKAAVAAAKAEAGIQSPSKLFRDEVGVWISEGIASGILKAAGSIYDATKTVLNNALQSIRDVYAQTQATMEETLAEIAKSTRISAWQRRLERAETLEQIRAVQEEQLDELLDSEKKYYAEKRRIELEDENRQGQADKRREKENRLYLEELKETAENERKVEDQRAANNKAISEQLIKNARAVKEAQKKNGEAVMDALKSMYSEIQDKIEALADAQAKFADKLKSVTADIINSVKNRAKDLYESSLSGYISQFSNLSRDLTDDGYLYNRNITITKLKQYQDIMQQLKDREGMTDEFYQYVLSLDYEGGYKLAQQLLKKDAQRFKHEVDLWQETQDKMRETAEFRRGEMAKPTSLTDWKAETEALREYADAMKQLGERSGEATDFFREIRDLDVSEGFAQATELLAMSDKEFGQYIADWKEHQNEAKKYVKPLYKSEADELASEIEDKFDEVKKEFFGIGKDAAGQFETGFLQYLKNTLEAARDLISGSFNDLLPIGAMHAIGSIQVPAMATGGIVPHRTVAMLGEAGREAVLPLDRNTEWMDKLALKVASVVGGNNRPIILQIDGRELGRAVVNTGNAANRVFGATLEVN